jgi:hypothetical protein
VQSTLDFSVYLGSYQNIAANGSVCTGGCNNSFTFCLQEEFGGCDYGLINSSVIQSDDFIFDSALSELNISNPLLFNNIVPSTARLQLVVTVTNSGVELVDRVVVDIPRDTVVDMILSTSATTYIGELMNVNITLSFGIRNNCPRNMYGSGCSVVCQPQDNELGHYFCNYVGERICLDNYFQPNTNCSVFCEDTDNSFGHYMCDEGGRRVCLSGYTNTAQNCTQLVSPEGEEEEDNESIATSAGLIVVYIFVGYFAILSAIVALFCVCFVHCNCTCVHCCNSSFCFRLKCSPKILRKQRLKINCPSSVATKTNALQQTFSDKCCPCCSDIDMCDSDELAFWTEVVILVILCLPFAICFVALYAYAKSK